MLYSEAGVKLTTADGAVFGGRFAIVTVPLGCLKAGDVRFSPPLPRRKAAAIQRLGMGLLDKVRPPEALLPILALPVTAKPQGRAIQAPQSL